MARLSEMSRRNLLQLLLAVLVLVGPWMGVSGALASEEEVVLLGNLTREEIESALPDWVAEQVEANPDPEAAADLAAELPGAEVTIYLGTWCSDSRRELARLWRALDEAGVLSPAELRYIGVDRDKVEPVEWIGAETIYLVPTLIVRRQGEEIGRIVESSPNGIERDLASLLAGTELGLITDSAADLEAAMAER